MLLVVVDMDSHVLVDLINKKISKLKGGHSIQNRAVRTHYNMVCLLDIMLSYINSWFSRLFVRKRRAWSWSYEWSQKSSSMLSAKSWLLSTLPNIPVESYNSQVTASWKTANKAVHWKFVIDVHKYTEVASTYA